MAKPNFDGQIENFCSFDFRNLSLIPRDIYEWDKVLGKNRRKVILGNQSIFQKWEIRPFSEAKPGPGSGPGLIRRFSGGLICPLK